MRAIRSNQEVNDYRQVLLKKLAIYVDHMYLPDVYRSALMNSILSYNGTSIGPDDLRDHLKAVMIRTSSRRGKTDEQVRSDLWSDIYNSTMNAGRETVRELMDRIEASSSIVSISRHRQAILDLAPHYSPNDIKHAQEIWSDAASAKIDEYVGKIEEQVKGKIDPHKTPRAVEREAGKLGRFLERYDVSADDAEAYVGDLARKMWRKIYRAYVPRIIGMIDDKNVDKIANSVVRDIQLTLEAGWNGGVDIGELRKLSEEMLEKKEWRGQILTDVGNMLETNPEGWIYPDVINDVAKKSRKLKETPERIKKAITETMEIIEAWEREVS